MTITYILDGKLYVNLTNRCPNNCDFCIRNNHKGIGDAKNLWLEREPSKEEVLNDIKRRDLSEFSELVFCGYGEPTCRLDDLLWICKEIRKSSDITIRVDTNGLSDLINNRETAPEFENLVDILSISLNASSAQKYDAICHSQFGLDAFDAILTFAKKANKFVANVFLSVVDHDMDKLELKKCKEISQNIGVTLRVRSYIS